MPAELRYHVDLGDRVHHLVRVRLTVPAELAPDARVVLPVWTPGSYVVRNYVHHVQWIRATGADGGPVPLHPDGHTAWRLPPDVTGAVEVELELYANDLSVRTNHVDDQHALLIPAATFPYVDGAADLPHVVHLPPSPPDHRVWSLLPAGTEPDTYVADDRDHLIDSAFEVGDLTELTTTISGVPHTLVWAGPTGGPDPTRLRRELQAISRQARVLMGSDLPVPRYLVLIEGWDQGGGGLEHRDGAVLQVPVHTFQDAALIRRFQSLLAHEYLHLWNVKRLVPADLVHPDPERPTHSPSLWVAEGWTAYYDELLPTRAKLWTLRQLLDAIRETYERVTTCPGVRVQSLRQSSYQAWVKHYVRDENSVNAGTDYYGHGALVALELDLRLRAADPAGDGLDAVLRLLWDRHGGHPEGYTEQDVLDAIALIGSDQLAALTEARVAEPGPPVLDDEVLAAVGLRWTPDEGTWMPPEMGILMIEDPQGIMLSSVLRGGPAWRAGLTGGDRLIAVDGATVPRGTLTAVLHRYRPGDQVEVTVTRGPRLITARVTLDEPRKADRLTALPTATTDQRRAFQRWTGGSLGQL